MVGQLYGDTSASVTSDEDKEALLSDDQAAASENSETAPTGATSVGGFTCFQLMQNLGSCAWYFIALKWPLHDPATGPKGTFVQVYIQAALLAFAIVGFYAVDVRDAKRKRRHEG